MNHHGFHPSVDELSAMIENVDKNSNGTIDYDEFVEMMLGIEDEEENDDVAQAFKVFYRDGEVLVRSLKRLKLKLWLQKLILMEMV